MKPAAQPTLPIRCLVLVTVLPMAIVAMTVRMPMA